MVQPRLQRVHVHQQVQRHDRDHDDPTELSGPVLQRPEDPLEHPLRVACEVLLVLVPEVGDGGREVELLQEALVAADPLVDPGLEPRGIGVRVADQLVDLPDGAGNQQRDSAKEERQEGERQAVVAHQWWVSPITV